MASTGICVLNIVHLYMFMFFTLIDGFRNVETTDYEIAHIMFSVVVYIT